MIQCKKCRNWKDETDFHRDSAQPNGYVKRCKVCTSEYMKLRRKNSPDGGREAWRRWSRSGKHGVRQSIILTDARRRAKDLGLAFTITAVDIPLPEKCPILGIPLRIIPGGGRYRCDNSASLDRIDPRMGYVPGNVCIISWRANRIKNNGTAWEHEAIASYMRAAGVSE